MCCLSLTTKRDGTLYLGVTIHFARRISVAALAIGFTDNSTDWITALLGQARIRNIAGFAAFILLCVVMQITMNGVLEAASAQGCFSGKS